MRARCYPITNMGPYGRQSRSTILRARTAKCELKCELELAFWLLNLPVPYNLASVLGHFLNNNERVVNEIGNLRSIRALAAGAGARARPDTAMASSSRRGARRDATASSASARAGPAAGADLEALVRELLELERFTERRERMLSRTQTRQLERHEREQRDAREREAIAARLARELTVSRERLERLERRERRRRETRARRVETTGSRDAREDDRETRAETSSRRSRSAPLDAESDRLDHRGRRDHHEREGARDEPAARRVDTVARVRLGVERLEVRDVVADVVGGRRRRARREFRLRSLVPRTL